MVEQFDQLLDMRIEAETARDLARTFAQSRVVVAVVQAFDDRVGQRGARGRAKMAVDALDKPLRNAAHGECCRRQSSRSGFDPDAAERLGTQARTIRRSD